MEKTDLPGLGDPTQQDVNSSLDNCGNAVMAATSSEGDEEMSVIDDSLELSDPTPNILRLFHQLNKKFFWGKLADVKIKWSTNPWMVVCSGKFCYKKSNGLALILLSELLLKYRPRKNLVQTLLHEMIHAYLTTQNIQDNDDHGDEFCKHMERINQLGRCNISIHHNFHDEVKLYSDLWWRCDGPCQAKEPFLGYEVGPTNCQAPSVSSLRKSKHDKTCGGKYIKVPKPDYCFLKRKGKKIS